MALRDGRVLDHGPKELCVASSEYNCSPFRCLLGSGYRQGGYGRTRMVPVGTDSKMRPLKDIPSDSSGGICRISEYHDVRG